ncbi:MAG: hypothetical protein HY926_10545 [Elusimicrobia bacterium]|nr:hypothetical protein [Elusimicrobiota bacterium]
MSDPGAFDPTPQLVIVARLSEYCQFRSILKYEADPWDFMLRKLKETEEPLAAFKDALFRRTRERLLAELAAGFLDEERCSDYRLLFERLLSPGDFADVAIHLCTGAPNQTKSLRDLLGAMQPATLFTNERKPEGQRSAAWDKLVGELYRRLDLDRLGTVMVRKPSTPTRKAMVLRRVRRNVAEYCTVVRIPTDPRDTFTPFMLPRIEALIAANLRFLLRYR